MYQISVQRACANAFIPTTAQLKNWAKTILKQKVQAAEITLRIVDKDEMTQLNGTYRNKNKPTNVLSFPYEMPSVENSETPLLGDIVICADVIEEEAKDQNKTPEAHWAHMVTHGILHILGYDHEKNEEAEIMEAEEITILKKLGFANPYQISEKGE